MSKTIYINKIDMDKANECLAAEIDTLQEVVDGMLSAREELFASWEGAAASSAQTRHEDAETFLAAVSSGLEAHHRMVGESVEKLLAADAHESGRYTPGSSVDIDHGPSGMVPTHEFGDPITPPASQKPYAVETGR